MDADEVRRRLVELAAKTESARRLSVPGFWGQDNAAERRARDDLAAGRLAWREAHRAAELGLAALEAGDLDLAQEYLAISLDWYTSALESRLEPHDVHFLTTSAAKRGRRKKNKKEK